MIDNFFYLFIITFNKLAFFTFTLMLLQQFGINWKNNFPHFSIQNCHLLVAVSGGIDSIVLVDLLQQLHFSFSIAHCNFELRGEESERDELFVTALAKRYDKPLFVQKFNTQLFAEASKLSIQEAARKLRYDWFSELISSRQLTIENQTANNNFIVTAHQANDNIETLLLNFFRGTGISGLHGIPPKQGNIIRPLLFAKRNDILQYTKENDLHWVEDSSNASDKYTRNFFRHQVLPLVKEKFANTEDNLLQNIHRFSEAELLYQQAIDLHKKKLLEIKGAEVHIPVLKLQKMVPLQTILWEIVKDFHFASAQLNDIQSLLSADNGKYVASSSHRIIRNRAWLIIAPLQSEESEHILIQNEDDKVAYEEGKISFKKLPVISHQLSPNTEVASLDSKQIQYPLLLRKWKAGDYFYPLGMKKKKKLSKFFTDLKLSKTDKERVWVIEMNKKIVWVINYRIDDRFKVTDTTKEVLVIEKK